MSKEYVSTAEAAAIMHVSARTVAVWCKNGKLSYIRAGKNYKVLRADCLELARVVKGVGAHVD